MRTTNLFHAFHCCNLLCVAVTVALLPTPLTELILVTLVTTDVAVRVTVTIEGKAVHPASPLVADGVKVGRVVKPSLGVETGRMVKTSLSMEETLRVGAEANGAGLADRWLVVVAFAVGLETWWATVLRLEMAVRRTLAVDDSEALNVVVVFG